MYGLTSTKQWMMEKKSRGWSLRKIAAGLDARADLFNEAAFVALRRHHFAFCQ